MKNWVFRTLPYTNTIYIYEYINRVLLIPIEFPRSRNEHKKYKIMTIIYNIILRYHGHAHKILLILVFLWLLLLCWILELYDVPIRKFLPHRSTKTEKQIINSRVTLWKIQQHHKCKIEKLRGKEKTKWIGEMYMSWYEYI